MNTAPGRLRAPNRSLSYFQFFTIASSLIFTYASAQEDNGRWILGGGITYCSYVDNPGLNLNATYRVARNFHIGPDFSSLLTKEVNEGGVVVKRKELEYNFNAHQLFDIRKTIAIYPLVGINWSKLTLHPEGQEPDVRWITALNAGGGVEVKIKKIQLFFESKWVSKLDKYDLTTGILFAL